MSFFSRLFEPKEAKAERLKKEAHARLVAEEAEKKRRATEAERQRIAREVEKKRQAEEAEQQRLEAEKRRKENEPLLVACAQGKIADVRRLLDRGCDVNYVGSKSRWENRTPLHFAALRNYTAVIDILLERGADLEARDQNGYTPLHLAAGQSNVEAVACLVNAGCDVRAKSSLGSTALEGVLSWGTLGELQVEIVNILSKAEGLEGVSYAVSAIPVSDNPLGRSVKKLFEHFLQSCPDTKFDYAQLPDVDSDYLDQTRHKIRSLPPGTAVLDSAEKMAKSAVLKELQSAGLIEVFGYESFKLTTKGEKSSFILR